MKTNSTRNQPTVNDTMKAALRVRPVLTWLLTGSIGLYASLLLDPAAQRWVLDHHLAALKAVTALLVENAAPILWVAALFVAVIAALQAASAQRRGVNRLTLRLARIGPAALSRFLHQSLR